MFEKNPWKLKRLVPQLRLHEEKLASSAGWRQIFECIEIEDNDQVNKTMNGAELRIRSMPLEVPAFA